MFCNKCGSQIPDGIPTCPNCGAPTAVAAAPKAPSQSAFVNPFAGGFNKGTFFATAKSLNIPGLVLALLGLICIFLPGVGGGGESYGLISYEFVSVSQVSLISLIIAFMIGFGILYFLKKDVLAFFFSIINFIFTMICFCVANSHFHDVWGARMGWGFIVYFILTILMIVPPIIWPTIVKLIQNKPARPVYQQPVYQQPMQPGQAPMQQPMYQQPMQQAPQQPMYQQPVQQAPQQPQAPQQ